MYRLGGMVSQAAKEPCVLASPVGKNLSSILNHRIRCSTPSYDPTYTVPDTGLRLGPAVVVNRAERAFSGSSAFRIAPIAKALDACSSLSFATSSLPDTSIW